MHSIWSIVKSILEAEERALIQQIQKTELKIPTQVSKTISITERTLDTTFELSIDGVGWIETIVLKTTDTNWTITIVTEQGAQYYNASFNDLSSISLGNPQLDAQDRTSYEGYYFVVIKNVRFAKRLDFYLRPKPSTYVKNLYILYYRVI